MGVTDPPWGMCVFLVFFWGGEALRSNWIRFLKKPGVVDTRRAFFLLFFYFFLLFFFFISFFSHDCAFSLSLAAS